MDGEHRRARALSFGPVAQLYDRVRPSYPAAAARWILGEQPLRVVDLGAGTGKFSRLLAALGHEVVAVEPDPMMLDRLEDTARREGVEVTALAGSAEAIPLPAASVDAVVAAQSYHWFDTDGARGEIARVVRPGGVFGPIWNLRDEAVEWVAELTRTVLGDSAGVVAATTIENLGQAFDPPERAEFRHAVEQTHASLLDLVRSRSKYLVAGERERRELEAAVAAITRGLPQTFELPYITVAFRARRR